MPGYLDRSARGLGGTKRVRFSAAAFSSSSSRSQMLRADRLGMHLRLERGNPIRVGVQLLKIRRLLFEYL